MTTNMNFTRTRNTIRCAFWRLAAQLTGMAVRKKMFLKQLLTYIPLALAGAAAYVLGRLAGEILLRVFPM